MNSTHRKTLAAIFANPINGNLPWRKIEALLLAVGAQKDEGAGAAVTFFLNGQRADFHRPHPQKEALKYRIKAVRELLENAGIEP
ncbi:type II toxin-antitoxin system HicA family toxin [Rhodoferax sp. 4810]|uniref:Type II toxin-antitoxin system HicA family toxin n=1 Tax=Thiospirillum jenense TaxID=1653858 RepID=A0A839H6V6_9GAMM|nr:type II toxin-antitoxin system HicA family toxin [Thiospirillum jenense]MBB1074711.1 type II toxin-antitoxin system HicA family toxin [Rhodoferax jenense]MBB1125445.1 type II toxin-antitoxin system HicA family toxin [Thiospirillum jenense]